MSCVRCFRSHSDPYDCTDVRGLLCQRAGCGKTIQYPVTLANVGAFCSHRCKTEVEMAMADTSPRELVTEMDTVRRG